MRTCVFILPVLWLGCGFTDDPIKADHELDPRVFESDGVVVIRDRDSATEEAPGRGRDAATAGASAEDAAAEEPDATAPQPDAAAAPDAAQPTDAASLDAQPPDASPPDAAPPVDAHVPEYTDTRICQSCSATDQTCGPQSVCLAPKFICIPKRLGASCTDVCGGRFQGTADFGIPAGSAEHVFGCTSIALQLQDACAAAIATQACWN